MRKQAQISIPLLPIMFLIFLTLKLTGEIAWSWWWVTAPLWMPFAIILGIGVIALIFVIITSLMKK